MATLQRRHPQPPIRVELALLVPATLVPGRQVTVAAYIIEQVKAGVDPVNAAGVVGVVPPQYQAWVRDGILQQARFDAGADWYRDFTPEQQDSALFASAVLQAHSSHIGRLEIVAEQMARGQLPELKTTTRKTVAGQVVEETVRIEQVAADPAMVRWKLTKLEPALYGDKATLNVTVTDMTDSDPVGDALEARMFEVAKRLADQRAARLALTALATEEITDGEQPPAAI